MALTSTPDLENNNEINAIKLAIYKSLKKNTYTSNSKIGYIKTMTIELPLSPQIFNEIFQRLIPKLGLLKSPPISSKVSVNEMKMVLGNNWHIYKHSKSTTRQRILGIVDLKYRQKEITITRTHMSRYKYHI